jgi:hypothetical protein
VKEDIVSRFYELGFFVNDGKINFDPTILRKTEFIEEEKSFKYVNLNNDINYIELDKHSLAFTVCQVPIIYSLSVQKSIRISYMDNTDKIIEGHELDAENSESIFNRTNLIKAVYVSVVK